MNWPGPLVRATLIRRYKRFLADFTLPDGQTAVGHCVNTGSMKTCIAEGAPCWLTHHDNPKRKLKYSWQAIHMPDGWVGVNTSLANALTVEAINAGVIAELQGYADCRTEKKYGHNSRVDIFLSGPDRPDCYVEVKNVTLLLEAGTAGFPDAVTQRGAKHLQELRDVLSQGDRAVLLYCVQRASANRVAAADRFDPHYAATLRKAALEGLEIYAYQAEMSESAIALKRALPVTLSC